MIVLQDGIDVRPVKIDWYWSEQHPEVQDGSLRVVDPLYVITETLTGTVN